MTNTVGVRKSPFLEKHSSAPFLLPPRSRRNSMAKPQSCLAIAAQALPNFHSRRNQAPLAQPWDVKINVCLLN